LVVSTDLGKCGPIFHIKEDLHRRDERLIVIHAAYRCLAIAALALLAGCTTSKLVRQEANPQYVGKPLKSVMVVGVTADEIVRRTFEDRFVALLGQRGIKGIPGPGAIVSGAEAAKTVTSEASIFAAKGEKLIWSARVRTTNTQSTTGADYAPQYVGVILEAMKKDKLL
jgi:hypothetical protein